MHGDLDEQYSPSSCVPDYAALLDGYRERSAAARAAYPPATHRYGPDPDAELDLFAAAGRDRPAAVFVHGGYWQELGKADASFPAPGLVRAGVDYLALGYGLAPRLTLDEIVAQARGAVRWITEHAAPLGIDPARIVLSGSSAGAHLVAMTVLDRRAGSEPAPAGLVLLSGVYELAPLLGTYVNDALGMDAATARRNSPARLVTSAPGRAIPTVIAWGEHETDAFKRQSTRFAELWRAAGNPTWAREIPGRNHFDLVHDLSDPGSLLGAQVARLHHSH